MLLFCPRVWIYLGWASWQCNVAVNRLQNWCVAGGKRVSVLRACKRRLKYVVLCCLTQKSPG